MNDEKLESKKRRDFLAHLGAYVIIIGGLGLINLFTSTYPWFLWPALGWGVGLVFHAFDLFMAARRNLSPKWRGFLRHLGSYVIIIGMLGIMNLLTSTYPWFLWPALGWGIGLAFHTLGLFLGKGESEEREERPMVEERHEAPAQPVERPVKKGRLTNSMMQAHLDKALAYQTQIERMIKATTDASARARLQDLVVQVGEWTAAVEDLARRIDNFQQNPLIHQDLATVPQSIAQLEARLAGENDPAIQTQLEHTLTNRRNQLASLERLQNTMKRAEIQIESTLSALGTIYSQILTGQSTSHVADYSRLSAEVDEEVHTLQDYLEALEEVKLGRL